MIPPERKGKRVQASELQTEIRIIKEIQLKNEKDHILKEINNMIDTFDTEICRLQKLKLCLESDLKSAQMRLIRYYNELQLLKGMESRDIALNERLKKFKTDYSNIRKIMEDIGSRLKENDELAQKKEEAIKAIENDFDEQIPNDIPEYPELLAFFKKRVKNPNQNRKERDPNDDMG